MKLKILIYVLSVVILLNGCMQLPQEEGKVWVVKHITQCAEEWQGWPQDKERRAEMGPITQDERITGFYEEKGISVYQIQGKKVRGEPCEACSCLSDIKLYLQISEGDKSYFLNQGYNIAIKRSWIFESGA